MHRLFSLLLLSAALHAQTFEAASVRPAAPLGQGETISTHGGPGTSDPERITYRGVALSNLITDAFEVNRLQLAIPDQFQFKLRYDIVAKIPPGTTKDQFNVMMQNLLADRFGLKFHREPKQFDMYKLTVAKGGAKLKPTTFTGQPSSDPAQRPRSDPDGAVFVPGRQYTQPRNGHLLYTAGKVTCGAFADYLEAELRSPVTDATGLTGEYDFKFEYSPEGRPLPPGVPQALANQNADAASTPAPNIFEALEKQLGLKLEKSTATLDMLIVDHLSEVPTDN